MSRELEGEIRDRLGAVVLPPAPERLLERARSVTTQPVARVAGGSPDRRLRLFAPLAAVVVIATAAGLGLRALLPTGDGNAGSQGPSSTTFRVEARIGEWCGPISCAFHIELTGPGGPWQGELEGFTLGESSPISPALPTILGSGSYELKASIHVISDAIEPGQLEGRDLGTTATCSAEFHVKPGVQMVDATIGFWLDRCSVGALAVADQPTLATFALGTTINGECGEFGCDYRVVLTGPGGTWPMVVSSQKPASQLAPGPAMPPYLPPGAYRLEASSHRMSEEPEPGVGHQHELGVAGACSTEFVMTPEVERIDATVTFAGVGCSSNANVERTVTAPTPDLAAPSPSTGPESTDGGASPGSRERWYGPAYPAEAPPGRNVPIERAALSGDGRTLTIKFWGGGCFEDYVPWVGVSGSEVLVSIVAVPVSGPPFPSGFACILVAYAYQYHLTLSEPYLGSTVRLGDGSVLIID